MQHPFAAPDLLRLAKTVDEDFCGWGWLDLPA